MVLSIKHILLFIIYVYRLYYKGYLMTKDTKRLLKQVAKQLKAKGGELIILPNNTSKGHWQVTLYYKNKSINIVGSNTPKDKGGAVKAQTKDLKKAMQIIGA